MAVRHTFCEVERAGTVMSMTAHPELIKLSRYTVGPDAYNPALGHQPVG